MALSRRFRSRYFVIEIPPGPDSSRFAPVSLKGTIRRPWTFSSSERTARCTKYPEEFFRSATGGVLPKYESKYEDLQFELPRQGRTILVRSQKSGKVLRKFTWNGEKFVEQRDAAPN